MSDNGEDSDGPDEVTCDICFLHDAGSPDNRMLCCELCNINVHQSCYTVEGQPSKHSKWFCFPCKKGFQPDQLACALCKHTGGAYKRLVGDENAWVHALCVNWIPEVIEVDEKKDDLGPRVDLTQLSKARMKFQCMVCNQKGGACVQCAYRNCLSAVHPMCLMKHSYDCPWRVIEVHNKRTGVGYYRREMFCPRHADYVGQPLKDGELLIQLPSFAKFDIDDDYAPVVKPEYAGAVIPFPVPAKASANTTENTPVGKKKRAACVSALNSNAKPSAKTNTGNGKFSAKVSTANYDVDAVEVGQKRKRASMGDAAASPAPQNLPRGVPSKRPKTTIVKAVSRVSSGSVRDSPPRTHSGIKRGRASASATSSSSASGTSKTLSLSRQSIHEVLERAQRGGDVASSSSSSRSPQKTPRDVPGHMLVPPSPSLASVASPSQPRRGRLSHSNASSQNGVNRSGISTPEPAGRAGRADCTADTPTTPPSGRFNTRSAAHNCNNHNGADVPTSTRSTSFSPAGNSREALLPGLPAVKRGPQKKSALESFAATTSGGRGTSTTPAVVSTMSAAANTSGAAVLDSAVVQHIQSLLQQVLLGMLPTAAGTTTSHNSAAGPFSPPVVHHRICASSLPVSTWATLHSVGWRCLTMDAGSQSAASSSQRRSHGGSSSSSTISNNGVRAEEWYVTPGCVLTDDAVKNFSTMKFKENVQYFSSLAAFRIHLAQNPVLLHPWAETWQVLQQHDWRALYSVASRHRPAAGGSGNYSYSWHISSGGRGHAVDEDEDGPPQPTWIYLSAQHAASSRDAADSAMDSAAQSEEEGSDADYDHAFGASRRRSRSGSGRGDSAGGTASTPVFVQNCIDGVHRFRSWRELQCYIHRYPYLLQDDATFTNTLLIHGWRQRLYIKPERHTLNSDSRSSRGRGNNSEFLWQSAHILEAADFVDNDRGDEDGVRDGVWLSIDELRRYLWVEPTRLFRPYDVALNAIRVTTDNLPSAESITAIAPVVATASSSSAAAPAPTAVGEVGGSDVQQLRAEFGALLAEVDSLKKSYAESQVRSRKLESRLERHQERRREKRERRRSGEQGQGLGQDQGQDSDDGDTI